MDSLSAKNPTNNPRMDLLHNSGNNQLIPAKPDPKVSKPDSVPATEKPQDSPSVTEPSVPAPAPIPPAAPPAPPVLNLQAAPGPQPAAPPDHALGPADESESTS